MKIIKFITPQLELFQRVAVVGSSGALKNKKYGREIDTFEDVIRFNRAPIKGFENMVGSRETLRIVNNHVYANISAGAGWSGQPRDFVKNMRNAKILFFAPGKANKREQHIHGSCKLYVFSYDKVGILKKRIGFPDKKQVSVGFGFILCCIESGIQPNLFGYDIIDRKRDHYWEERPGLGPTHAVNIERDCMKQLIKRGEVIFYD